ncbi:hypothetical protein BLS_009676 [Venturia inaequalis]|uniref:V-type proton ATPase subunit C n=2 Tax=Venturia inaequalis TaxID=5025 RepID=A0A8H3V2L2_VENIN|nr:hypothetical protein BLS_009676 [Venturia inaequalis]
MAPNKYLLVSLPTSISQSGDKDEALTALRSSVSTDNGTTVPFTIPEFKIGTLDALVQQADDLAKLSNACEAVVGKVGDSLRSILDGDEDKIEQQKTINDKPVDQYLRSFQWNKVKYRADKSIAELIDSLQKEIVGIDNDVKAKFNQYSSVKTNLAASQRRQTGNLSTKSLTSIVSPKSIIRDSEYLETHLVAVPNTIVKDFYKTYESLSDMVVPRSAQELAKDDEFTLFGVVSFKKVSAEFVHKAREARWIPRDYKYVEGGKEQEAKEVDSLSKEERKVWGEALRLGRTGYSEGAMIWVHVLALRVFVETVLRYGLPLDFVAGLVQTNAKLAKKVKSNLDGAYSYLAGNAIGRDKKGRAQKDDSAMQAELAAAHGGEDYTAYVYYEFEIVSHHRNGLQRAYQNQNQLFLDIFPLFRSPRLTEIVISHLCSYITETYPNLRQSISAIVCLEARGFFFAPVIASRLGLPVVPVRKKGKLPGDCVGVQFMKDYGADDFEMKTDAFEEIETGGKKVLLMDDLLGKGGSIMAAKGLCEKLNVKVAEAIFIFDCDGVPGYQQTVNKTLGGLKRYAMITLSTSNIGAPVN